MGWLGSWYVVLKKIKGHIYAYKQKTYRQHQNVRTLSEYIGRADHLAPIIQKRGVISQELTLHGHPLLTVPVLSDRAALAAWENGKLVTMTPADLLPQSEKAILEYIGHGYRRINQALRGDIPLTSEIKREILGLRAAIYDERAVLTENVVLYRAGLIPLHKCRLGEVFTESSIVSFTANLGMAREWHNNVSEDRNGYIKCIFRNIARKGDGRYLSLAGFGGGEHEIITGNSRFEVIEIKRMLGVFYITIGKVGNDI